MRMLSRLPPVHFDALGICVEYGCWIFVLDIVPLYRSWQAIAGDIDLGLIESRFRLELSRKKMSAIVTMTLIHTTIIRKVTERKKLQS